MSQERYFEHCFHNTLAAGQSRRRIPVASDHRPGLQRVSMQGRDYGAGTAGSPPELVPLDLEFPAALQRRPRVIREHGYSAAGEGITAFGWYREHCPHAGD